MFESGRDLWTFIYPILVSNAGIVYPAGYIWFNNRHRKFVNDKIVQPVWQIFHEWQNLNVIGII